MKSLRFLTILAWLSPVFGFAQSIGVGTTTPDASAALDVQSVTQGMLVPRMSTAQRTAISNPANGLLVFDLTTNSFWFKGNSQWIELIDTSNTVVHKMGTDIYMGMVGKVGIGTAAPNAKLEVKTTTGSPGISHTDGNVIFQTNTTTTSSRIGTTSNHSLQLFANNAANQLTLATNGYVGINTSSPQQQLHVNGNGYLTGLMGIGMAVPEAPLHFASGFGDKIALYGTGGSYYGIGVANGMMQLYAPNASSAIGFGYGSSGNFTENMRISGNGNVGIGTTNPTERLTVSGNGNFSGNLAVGGGITVGLGVAIAGGIAVGGAAAFAAGGGFGGAVSVGAPSPSASAQLDVSSTTKGFLQPRMTTAQRDAIPSPPEGLTVYNTDTHSPNYRDNEEWKELKEDSTANHEEFVFRSGPHKIYMAMNDSLGVGTMDPAYKFQVKTTGGAFGFSHTNGTVNVATLAEGGAQGGIGTITNHRFELFTNNQPDQFVLNTQGQIGIGTAAIHGTMQFASTSTNKKIVLSETQNDNNHYSGFGNSNGSLRYQVSGPGESHTFYAATSPADNSTMLLKIAGSGALTLSNTAIDKKIIMQDVSNDNSHFAGFGSNGGSLRYQVANSNDSHSFYAGAGQDTSALLMRIKANGNIGMGVSTPNNKLDIHAVSFARTGAHPSNLPLYVTGNQSDAANGIEFRSYDGTEGIGFGKNTIYAAGNNTNQNMGLAAKGTTGAVKLLTNGLERLFINGAGNIGIGTVTPNAPVQLANLTANRKMVLYETANNDHQFFGFGVNPLAIRYQVDGPGSSHIFYAGSSSSTSNELMRITGQGYVGIGVQSPLADLEVARGTGTNGTAVFRGTTYFSHFNFSTNEDTYIRGGKDGANVLINDNVGLGNVGIGTPVPFQKLHVEGNTYISGNEGVGISVPQNKVDIQAGSARSGTHPIGLPLYVTGDMGSESQGVEIRHSNGSQGVGIGFNTVYATGNNSDQDLGLSARGLGSLIFKTQAAERMRINGSGNVGIGTSSPNAPLQFANTIQNRKIVMWESANNDHQFYGLGINGSTLRYQVGNVGDNHVFYAGTSPTTSAELMRIQGNGNVGIGIGYANEKLVVDGNIAMTGQIMVGYSQEQNQYTLAPLTFGTTVYCGCPNGSVVLGGGWYGEGLDVFASRPSGSNLWSATANNVDVTSSHTLYVYAICARLGQ